MGKDDLNSQFKSRFGALVKSFYCSGEKSSFRLYLVWGRDISMNMCTMMFKVGKTLLVSVAPSLPP